MRRFGCVGPLAALSVAAVVGATGGWVAPAAAGCPPGQVEDDDGHCKSAPKAQPKPTASPPTTTTGGPPPKPLPKPTAPVVTPPAPPASVDSDGDGIADGADACPARAEDQNGFADADGCPDEPERRAAAAAEAERQRAAEAARDNDGDGVRNADDRCPTAREDDNGFQPGDGCPDEVERRRQEAAEKDRLAKLGAGGMQAAGGGDATRRAVGVGLVVGGGALVGLMGGMLGWREATAATIRSTAFDTFDALYGAIDTANLATGLAVGSGVLGAALVGAGLPLVVTAKASAPRASAWVGLTVTAQGVLVGGTW
jgi:hypothetical protein